MEEDLVNLIYQREFYNHKITILSHFYRFRGLEHPLLGNLGHIDPDYQGTYILEKGLIY